MFWSSQTTSELLKIIKILLGQTHVVYDIFRKLWKWVKWVQSESSICYVSFGGGGSVMGLPQEMELFNLKLKTLFWIIIS